MIEKVVCLAAKRGASDIHIVAGTPAKIRVDGKLVNLTAKPVTHEMCLAVAREVAEDHFSQLQAAGDIDLAKTLAGRRCRIHLFHQQNSISVAIRLLQNTIPQLEALGLPSVVPTFTKFKKGIVLVTGETGSGKSTTLAAMLDRINHTQYKHIVTLEDPIEYIYKPDKCLINQREIGTDVKSYEDGLHAVLREDSDIILIGELRDLSAMEAALTAAETGHLVFATLHTASAVEAVERITGVFPENRQPQIRLQLSLTLQAVLSQQLLERADGHGRVLACEVMMVTEAIRHMIREGKTPQIFSSMLASGGQGSVTMDRSLIHLAMTGAISRETAVLAGFDQAYLEKQFTQIYN